MQNLIHGILFYKERTGQPFDGFQRVIVFWLIGHVLLQRRLTNYFGEELI
jgi:hypothetical protein